MLNSNVLMKIHAIKYHARWKWFFAQYKVTNLGSIWETTYYFC